MNDNKRRGAQSADDEDPGNEGRRAITPDHEPSALERGARILERLRRSPPEGRDSRQ